MRNFRIARPIGVSSLLAVGLALLLATDGLAATAWSVRYPLPSHAIPALARTYGPGAHWEHTLLYAGGFLSTARSRDGKLWSAAVHIAPSGHGTDDANGSWSYSQPRIASSGARLYAIWAYTSVFEQVVYSSTIYFRTNGANGSPSSWTKARIIGSGGKVDDLRIAAVGSRVVVGASWSDGLGGTGDVALSVSDDFGATWAVKSVGPGRLRGLAVTPSLIAAAVDDGAGTTIDTSPDAGTTWSPGLVLAGHPHVSLAGGWSSIALAWADGADPGPTGIFMRLWSGTWGAARTVTLFDGTTVGWAEGPLVSLAGATTVGVAWARVKPASGAYEDLVWRETPDGGVTWRPAVVLKYATRSGPAWSNAPGAINWGAASQRFVVFTSGGPTTPKLYLRIGTGAS
jgi:hypothetical protein